MFSTFELTIAARYLRARRSEGFISVIAWFSLLGIALGVATLIIVLSVMNGFRQELLDRILGMNGHISVQSYNVELGLARFDEMTSKIKEIEGIVEAFPIIEGQVMATANGQARGTIVRGIRKTDLEKYDIIANNIISGDLDGFSEKAVVILGDRLARTLGVQVGDNVIFVSPKGRSTVVGTVPRSKAYRVSALFNIGMYEYDSSVALMSVGRAQLYFMLPDKVSKLNIFVDNPDEVAAISAELKAFLQNDVRIYTWKESHSHFFNALQVERNVMFLI